MSSADDAGSYRDRLKVLRMKAGLDNGANADSKVRIHLFVMCSIPQNLWIFDFPLLNIHNLENGQGRPACTWVWRRSFFRRSDALSGRQTAFLHKYRKYQSVFTGVTDHFRAKERS